MASVNRIPLSFAPTIGGSFDNMQLDASGEKNAVVFQLPEDATITHCGFRYGARTGTPPTYRIGLQGVDGSGNPDGTFLGGGSPASATFTPPADATWDATWQWIALANSIGLTRGQIVAWVIEYSSGTIDASNRSSFTGRMSSSPENIFPYANEFNGTSWVKQDTAVNFGVKSASKTYGVPGKALPSDTSTNTAGNRVTMKFTVPKELASQYTCVGMRGLLQTNPGGSITWGLWNAAGTAIQTKASVDSDWVRNTAAVGYAEAYFDETTLTVLTGGTTYYLGMECVSGVVRVQTLEVESSAEMTAFPGGADICYSLWNGSAWADTNDRRPILEPILADSYGRAMPTWLMGM